MVERLHAESCTNPRPLPVPGREGRETAIPRVVFRSFCKPTSKSPCLQAHFSWLLLGTSWILVKPEWLTPGHSFASLRGCEGPLPYPETLKEAAWRWASNWFHAKISVNHGWQPLTCQSLARKINMSDAKSPLFLMPGWIMHLLSDLTLAVTVCWEAEWRHVGSQIGMSGKAEGQLIQRWRQIEGWRRTLFLSVSLQLLFRFNPIERNSPFSGSLFWTLEVTCLFSPESKPAI